MSTANVIAFPATTCDLDIDAVRTRAATLDVLADVVDGIMFTLPTHVAGEDLGEQLRSVADVLFEHTDAEVPDELAIRRLLPRSVELMRRGTETICHASARRMFGSALYARVSSVVMTLGDLGTHAYFAALDDRPDATIDELPLRRFGRVAAIGFDWAQWNVDAPPALRDALVTALRDAPTSSDDDLASLLGDDALPDAAPLAGVLDQLHDAWLRQVPADVLAEYVAERERHDAALGDCFDLGLACSIARRLLMTPHAEPVRDTVDVNAWLAAAEA